MATIAALSRISSAATSSAAADAVRHDDARVTADQAAGTASIRTLGTGAQQAAAGNHSHAGVTILTDAPTIATNGALGRYFRVTLTASRTLGNPTNLTDGPYTWEIIQDATGGWALTLDTMFAFGSEIQGVTLTTIPNKRDFLGGIYNSTTGLIYVIALTRGY